MSGLVSDFLTKRPKFSAQFAIQFGTSPTATSPCAAEKTDSGKTTVTLASSSLKLRGEANNATQVALAPQIAAPMKFFAKMPSLKLGSVDVIVCGHRICTGNKCCDGSSDVPSDSCETHSDNTAVESNDEPIMVVPVAPPLPQTFEFANVEQEDALELSPEEVVMQSLRNAKVALPASTVMELLMAKTELATRLEMTEQKMAEREESYRQLQALAEKNARLASQLAVAESKLHMSETLTASLIERNELVSKLSSQENRGKPVATSSEVKVGVQSIQEDLSNIRRQIALLRRPAPVPFAHSTVGTEVSGPIADYLRWSENAVGSPYIPTSAISVSAAAGEAECGADCACHLDKSTK